MADPLTPNYGYTLPTVGLDRDVWGDLENHNWSKLDTDLRDVAAGSTGVSTQLTNLINSIRAYIEPIGSIKPWPTPTAPIGWFPCDGAAVSRADYSGLYALIGSYWGAGDGSTTFNLPNFRGYTLVHRDGGGIGVGTYLGENTHTLTVNEMPFHGHPGSATDGQGDHSHSYSGANPGGINFTGGPISTGGTATTGNAGFHAHNVSVAGQGGGAAHNNMQASVGMLWIIKAANLV